MLKNVHPRELGMFITLAQDTGAPANAQNNHFTQNTHNTSNNQEIKSQNAKKAEIAASIFKLPEFSEAEIHAFMKREDIPFFQALVPAFIISEIKMAFQIGFLIFLPFIIIDFLISSILMAIGMMMLPPVTISLPFKLIFFALADGWHLICAGLIKSYHLF